MKTELSFNHLIEDFNPSPNGIGTLSEKTLHAYIKHQLEPNPINHEHKLDRFVVDIFDGTQITEIQTKQFFKLIPKLNTLLPSYPITIVYPIAHTKYLSWIDPITKSQSKARKSPKTGTHLDAIEELYALKAYLNHPNLSIQLIYYDILETRHLNGWSDDKKRGSHRHNRVPYNFKSSTVFKTLNDYTQLLPDTLPESFTTQDLKLLLKTSLRKAQLLTNILSYHKLIQAISKQGRYVVYKRINKEECD